jgi:hypothetical protein
MHGSAATARSRSSTSSLELEGEAISHRRDALARDVGGMVASTGWGRRRGRRGGRSSGVAPGDNEAGQAGGAAHRCMDYVAVAHAALS